MRQSKSPLRGSVTQNNVSARARVSEQDGIGFLARLGLLAGFFLVLLVLMIWGWRSGWPQREASMLQEEGLTLTQKAQLEVKDIVVEGRGQSSKDDIYDALRTMQGAPILAVDMKAAASRLGKLPWVGSVAVERRLPNTIAVILTERVPAARWQHDDRLYVIDGEGHVLPAAKVEDFPGLPLVVGAGAERETQTLLTLLKAYPDIRNKTDSAVRVGERRWDLQLQSRLREAQSGHNDQTPAKLTVRLPEENVNGALRRLSVLITQEKILDRDIVAIDLRIPDRLAIEPASDAKQPGVKPAGGAHP